jgi:hypothetical protein
MYKLDEELSKKKNTLFSQYYYILPIPTWKFATIEMISSLLIIFSISFGTLIFIHIVVGRSVPFIGPLLFLTSFYLINEGIEYTIGRIKFLLVIFVVVIDIPLLFWFGRRFGAPFIVNPAGMWITPTLNEFLFMLLLIGLGYIFQIIGIEKDRRGEAWGISIHPQPTKQDMKYFPFRKYKSPAFALFHLTRNRGMIKKSFLETGSGKNYFFTLPYKDMEMASAILKSSALNIFILSMILILIMIPILYFFRELSGSWKENIPILLFLIYLSVFFWMLLMWILSFSIKSPIYLKIFKNIFIVLIISGLIFINSKANVFLFYIVILFLLSITSFIECYLRRFISLFGMIAFFSIWIILFMLTNILFLPLMNLGPCNGFVEMILLTGFIFIHMAPFATIPLSIYYTRHC